MTCSIFSTKMKGLIMKSMLKKILLLFLIIAISFSVIYSFNAKIPSTGTVDTSSTFNEGDQEKIINAIHSLKNSQFDSFDLVRWIYTVAFSNPWSLPSPASQVLGEIFVPEGSPITRNTADYINLIPPGLYSGDAVGESLKAAFAGEPKKITKKDLVPGDILLIQKDEKNPDSTKIYMYADDVFVEMKKGHAPDFSAKEILSTLSENDIYAVLRPSLAMTEMNRSLPEGKFKLSPEQKAIIGTAEAYLMRGDRIQYDDGHISPYSEYRWQHSKKSPEEYTTDDWGYTNCAAFVHDVYLYSIGYEKMEMYGSKVLINAPSQIRPFYYEPTGRETIEEQKAIAENILKILQPADIIVTRGKSSGHAMLYIGNGNIIHSTGSSYSYDNMKETYEPTVLQMSVNDLFTLGHYRNIFGGRVDKFAIVRPLNNYDGEIPENTINRVTTMKGIFAEKLSSHKPNQTVNPGEEIEYTFYIYNSNNNSVKLEIRDVVPKHTTYVKGAEKVDGNNLSWKVTVPAGEELTVSYTVKVDNDSALIDSVSIHSDKSTIGGVKYICHAIPVKKTLTKNEQVKLTQSANKLMVSEMTAFDKANAIYKDAGISDKILPGEGFMDIADGVFYDKPFDGDRTRYYPHGCFDLKREGIYSEMVVPTLYGGRGAWITPTGERTRLLREHYLIPGDIVLWRTADKEDLYMYTNDGLLLLNTGEYIKDAKACLEKMLGQYPDTYDMYFVVIRPSYTLK